MEPKKKISTLYSQLDTSTTNFKVLFKHQGYKNPTQILAVSSNCLATKEKKILHLRGQERFSYHCAKGSSWLKCYFNAKKKKKKSSKKYHQFKVEWDQYLDKAKVKWLHYFIFCYEWIFFKNILHHQGWQKTYWILL